MCSRAAAIRPASPYIEAIEPACVEGCGDPTGVRRGWWRSGRRASRRSSGGCPRRSSAGVGWRRVHCEAGRGDGRGRRRAAHAEHLLATLQPPGRPRAGFAGPFPTNAAHGPLWPRNGSSFRVGDLSFGGRSPRPASDLINGGGISGGCTSNPARSFCSVARAVPLLSAYLG